ncbi:unnamed protein product [Moneuplotes crassus]|uniref:Uncharacterized protein n=2 Tax=Euplotes crassus TaxID=5936 RepID=A0AAD1UD76_EUPCR|nr:unnamed protein product [Moneuplotes crassus]
MFEKGFGMVETKGAGEDRDEGNVPQECKCTRYHIDEYDEYYANYLRMIKKEQRQTKKINRLEKEIIMLKSIIQNYKESDRLNFKKYLSKSKNKKPQRISKQLDEGIYESNKYEERGNKRRGTKVKELDIGVEMNNQDTSFSESSEESLCSIIKQKTKSQFTQTYSAKRRKTFIASVPEAASSTESDHIGLSIKIPEIPEEDPLDQMTRDKYTRKLETLGLNLKGKENILTDHIDSMDVVKFRTKYGKKRANSFDGKNMDKNSETEKDDALLKVIENNFKLSEEIEELKQYSKENEELKEQLSKAIPIQQQKELILEKDSKINSLSLTLEKREEMYSKLMNEFEFLKRRINETNASDKAMQDIINEKEEELEKINYMNAEYRSQLIELKISMSKAKDANQQSAQEEYEVVVGNVEYQLEEARQQISNLSAKIKEKDSIIETLLSQAEYYKNKYDKDNGNKK